MWLTTVVVRPRSWLHRRIRHQSRQLADGLLTFVAFAQELLACTCELIRGSVRASPRGCAGLRRSALRSRLMAARFRWQGPLLVQPRVAEAALLPPNDTACAEFWMSCSGLGQAQQL